MIDVSVTMVMAVLCAVLFLPGFAVCLAARVPVRYALAAAVPVTYGIVAVSGYVYGLVNWRWGLAALILATAITAGLVFLVTVPSLIAARANNRGQLSRPERRANSDRAWSVGWWLPAIAVAVSAWLTGQMVLTELAGTNFGVADIFQGWDAHWHANYIRFIHDTGIAAPGRAGELRYPENSATLYYPSTWHSVAAVVMQLTGAGAVEMYNLAQIATLSLGFPLGVAALTWLATRTVLSGPLSLTATACAALATPLFAGLPFVEIMVAATPSAAGNGLAGLVAVLVVGALAHPRLIIPAAVALIGIGGVHPSAMVAAAVMVLAWWLFSGVWRPVVGRWSDLASLAVIGVSGVLTLLPQLLTISDEADDISAFEFQVDGITRAETWGKAVTLQVRHVQDWGVRWVLLALAILGLLVMLKHFIVWPLLLWGTLVVLTANAMMVFGNWTGGTLRFAGSVFYNDPRRLGVLLATLMAVAVGVGIAALAQGCATALTALIDPIADPGGRGEILARTAVALAAVVAVASWVVQASPEYAVAAGTSQRWDRMIDVHDRRAFEWLAQQPRAYEGLIYTNPDEGSGWMYATHGLPSVTRHYLRSGRVTPLSTGLTNNLDLAGSNRRVDRALRDLDITYVYISPPNYWGFHQPNEHLLHLDGTPGLVKVYADSQVRIFAVRQAFTDTQLARILHNSPFPPDQRTPLTRASEKYGTE